MLKINRHLSIPLTEFQFSFARGSGPGGQNVNKVNSKVTLRWTVKLSRALTPMQVERIEKNLSRRVSKDGDLIVTSHRFRDQGRNVADCLTKLQELLQDALKVPKLRKSTHVPRRSKKARLGDKRRQSEKKNLRRPPASD